MLDSHTAQARHAFYYLGVAQDANDIYKALTISREIDDRNGESTWLVNLGVAYGKLGMKDKAKGYYKEAIIILEVIESPNAEIVRGWLADLEKE
jgi:tetratricopeptide (TPR) repeat protein